MKTATGAVHMLHTAVVIGIAGHARSGKSTLSHALAERLGISMASFGQEVRRVAVEREMAGPAFSPEREALMRLGEELVSGGSIHLCKRVLAQTAWASGTSLVVEGIRHRVIVDDLRELVAPTPFFLVLVDADPAEREKRLAEEGERLTRAALDAHSTEREVDGLHCEAQLVVDGARPIEENVARVIAALRSSG